MAGDAPTDAISFLTKFNATADLLGRTDLSEAAQWLAAHPPPSGKTVIGHGDLHPFNVLVEGDRWTLLDWSTALIADPAL
jgi:aminoglycoside phosphotransferase (APT) family kinase protein